VDDALSSSYNSGGAFTCDTYEQLYGDAQCATEEIAETCCYCGGGLGLQASTTTAACVDGALNEVWRSGLAWTRTCATAATVQITLSMTATAEGKDEICEETNLDVGGGTYQSFVDALNATGVSTSSATFTLSCNDRRLASNHMRRLQADFELVASARFTDAVDANTFSESVTASPADFASAFEEQVATTLGVNATATVSEVELTVTSNDSAGAACQDGSSVLVWTLTLIGALSCLSIP